MATGLLSILHGRLGSGEGDRKAPHAAGSFGAQHGERLLGRRILVVEDEAMLAFDIELSLEDDGAEVIGPAFSLESALALVGGKPDFDAAILDVDLAGKDVFPVAERLSALGIPFVFHTGHGSRSELTSLFPGSVVCAKPTLSDTLITYLVHLIEDRQR